MKRLAAVTLVAGTSGVEQVPTIEPAAYLVIARQLEAGENLIWCSRPKLHNILSTAAIGLTLLCGLVAADALAARALGAPPPASYWYLYSKYRLYSLSGQQVATRLLLGGAGAILFAGIQIYFSRRVFYGLTDQRVIIVTPKDTSSIWLDQLDGLNMSMRHWLGTVRIWRGAQLRDSGRPLASLGSYRLFVDDAKAVCELIRDTAAKRPAPRSTSPARSSVGG